MHFIYVFLPRTDTLCIFTNGLMTLSFLGIQRQVPVFFILKGQIFSVFVLDFFPDDALYSFFIVLINFLFDILDN